MILTGYCPCPNRKADNGTLYQQQQHYLLIKEKQVEPRAKFVSDLLEFIMKWKAKGKGIIVMLDANEDVYSSLIGKAMTKEDALELVKPVYTTTMKKLTAPFFWGSKPIDKIWCSKYLDIVGAGAMPVGFGVGDHRLFYSLLVGEDPVPIKHPEARRLNSRIPRTNAQYNKRFKYLISKHHLKEKLAEAHRQDLSEQKLKGR